MTEDVSQPNWDSETIRTARVGKVLSTFSGAEMEISGERMRAGNACLQCGHAVDEHVMISFDTVPAGGAMVCPEMNCQCFNTWGVKHMQSVPFAKPSPEAIAAWQRLVQGSR